MVELPTHLPRVPTGPSHGIPAAEVEKAEAPAVTAPPKAEAKPAGTARPKKRGPAPLTDAEKAERARKRAEEENRKSGEAVAKIAAIGMHLPHLLTHDEIQSLCASVLSQR